MKDYKNQICSICGKDHSKDYKNQICSVCRKEQAKTECDNCGTLICRDCCKMEIWGSGAEDLSIRYFCPVCKDNPDVNPWGAHSSVSDIAANQETTSMTAKDKDDMAVWSKHPSVEKKRRVG